MIFFYDLSKPILNGLEFSKGEVTLNQGLQPYIILVEQKKKPAKIPHERKGSKGECYTESGFTFS